MTTVDLIASAFSTSSQCCETVKFYRCFTVGKTRLISPKDSLDKKDFRYYSIVQTEVAQSVFTILLSGCTDILLT